MKTEGHLEDRIVSSAVHITILPGADLFSLCGFQGAITGESQMSGEHPLKTGKSLGEPSTGGCISKWGVVKNANAPFISLRFSPDHRIGSFFPHHCFDVNKERKWALRSYTNQFLGNWVTGSPQKTCKKEKWFLTLLFLNGKDSHLSYLHSRGWSAQDKVRSNSSTPACVRVDCSFRGQGRVRDMLWPRSPHTHHSIYPAAFPGLDIWAPWGSEAISEAGKLNFWNSSAQCIAVVGMKEQRISSIKELTVPLLSMQEFSPRLSLHQG